MLKKEFGDTLREITMLGYGLIFLAHSIEKPTQYKDEKGEEIKALAPDLPNSAYQIVNGIVDIIGYIGAEFDSESDTSKRYIYTRPTKHIFAGSRYAHLAPKIPYGYQNLVDAVGDAIDKEVELGAQDTNEKTNPAFHQEEISFEQIMSELKVLWQDFMQKDREKYFPILREVVKEVFGQDVNLSQVQSSQKDLAELTLYRFREIE